LPPYHEHLSLFFYTALFKMREKAARAVRAIGPTSTAVYVAHVYLSLMRRGQHYYY
jgi:hypothetical protein